MEDKIRLIRFDSRFKRRKSRLKGKDRVNIRCSKQVYPFIYAYAEKHDLYIEEATNEILRTGIQELYFPDGVPRKERLLTRAWQMLRGQFRSTVTPLPLSKPKLKMGYMRNRVLKVKPGEN